MKLSTLQDFLEFVSTERNISIEKLKGRSRFTPIVEARQFYYYLSRKYSRHSVVEIGKLVNVDHSTVVHNLRTFNNLIETDENLLADLNIMEVKIDNLKSTRYTRKRTLSAAI